ncbi:probable E3 ubiquitin-protein ligase RHC1A [Rhagoletis pomonella]|uniref:probable E3 ubiquitin-protein ligase RHC1A n=1 Tax=Rhagoletis pomonella TaxID=28610 RepID=UPI001784D531|nr:probable E3 ubiquitin-protein ligase RHC1A [Rhagoletis pomonella]
MAIMVRSTENLAAMTAEASACSCAICLQEMPNGNDCWVTLCNHVFHKPCIERWVTDSPDCPVCRQCVNKRDLQPINPESRPNDNTATATGRRDARNSAGQQRYNTRSSRRLYEEVHQTDIPERRGENVTNAHLGNPGTAPMNLLEMNSPQENITHTARSTGTRPP